MFGDKTAKCGDQNNPDLYGKPMAGKALCLPQTIGSTTGGLVLYCACAIGPAAGVHAVSPTPSTLWQPPARSSPTCGSSRAKCRSSTRWARNSSSYVKDGMTVTIGPNGTVTVE